MNTPSKVTGDSYLATEFTQFSGEPKNAILSSGQSLANNDVQLKQAMARYASAGASFTDNGIADAYNLIAKGSYDLVTTYQDGAIYYFTTANANTGASTISINGLTAKNLKKNAFADDLFLGDIIADKVYQVYYSSAQDAFLLMNEGSSKLRVHAFVLWDQNGGVVTVHDSENMTSVTRPATGHTDFVFTTPTPDVNFVPVYMCGIDQGSNPYTINERDYTTNVRTTTTIKTIVQNNNDTIKDPAISSLTIYVRA